MQSNLYSEDLLFNCWNEFDGVPANYGSHPQILSYETGNYGFAHPSARPVRLPCPIDPMLPVACVATMMGPVSQRSYGGMSPALVPPLHTMGPVTQLPAQHFSFRQQRPQVTPPQQQYPPCPPPDAALERAQLNDSDQLEQVVVKNGQVFHISFLDESDEGNPPASLPTSDIVEEIESDDRDWINYDELPLLQNSSGTEAEDGRYQCDLCSKVLKSALNLYVHKQTHKATRLDCTICGKKFNRIGKLEHHIRRHHPTEQPNSARPSGSPVTQNFDNYCVECEEFFMNTDDLQSHMKQNHRLIDDSQSPQNRLKKSIGCPYCNEMFEWPCLLKTHMTKHTGEKPFICERCNVSFRFVQSFYRHNRRVHGREK